MSVKNNWRYTKGLHDLGNGLHAYLVPDGSWGWSNAGLITDGGQSLLVDTLFDLPSTSEMLSRMRDAVPAARDIGILVNTHGNGDHTFGNQLLKGSRIIATQGCIEDMKHRPPEHFAQWQQGGWRELGPGGRFWQEVMGSRFDFSGIELTLPTETFERRMDLTVGDKQVQLIEVGPAHTRGDILIYVPQDRVVFTGDILFMNSHPAVWAGPVSNWISACDQMLSWDVDVFVPGHGALADKADVREFRDYLAYLLAESRVHYEAGLPFEQAVDRLSMDRWAHWGEPERLCINVYACYREASGGTLPKPDVMYMLELMGERYFRSQQSKCACGQDHAPGAHA